MKRYKNIYFDLDRTLWDFERNAHEAFYDLYYQYNLSTNIPSVDALTQRYHYHNERLWEEYRKGRIKKEFLRVYRFQLIFNDFNYKDDALAGLISVKYLELAPLKTHLIPHTMEVLNYLTDNYSLHVITNGFQEVQLTKMEKSGISHFFDSVITSDSAGAQKPKSAIFEYALSKNNARKKDSIMVGDDLNVDIIGAKQFGMDQVYLNPLQLPHYHKLTYEISCLKELKDIF